MTEILDKKIMISVVLCNFFFNLSKNRDWWLSSQFLSLRIFFVCFSYQESKYTVLPRNVPFVIKKKEEGHFWPRLIKDKVKVGILLSKTGTHQSVSLIFSFCTCSVFDSLIDVVKWAAVVSLMLKPSSYPY